jgi:shikimate kinase
MAKVSLEDLYDYDSVIEGERENEYGETIYLHDGEWYTEEELIDELLNEDKAEIAAAGGFVSKEELDLNFPDYWDDNEEEEEDEDEDF